MSVVVRMEMPKSCPCDLVGYGYSMCCSAVSGIPKRVAEYDECVKNGTKPDWCPILCQLPEGHERLVDADKFIEHLFTKWQNGEISNSEWCDMRQWVNEETTIVPE